MRRRTLLARMCALPLIPAALGLLGRVAHAAWPEKAFKADAKSVALNGLFGTDSYADDGTVSFKAPEIAENGAVVPLTIDSSVPVAAVAVIVEKNPLPLAFHMELGGAAVAPVSSRIKMRESSNILAVVQDTDGRLHGTVKEVKVTIGGCGG